MKNIKILLSIFLVISSLTSCKKSLQEIITETEQATFIIYTYDEFGAPLGTGSGFFIEEKGIAVTNYHVLDNSIKSIIKTTNGAQYEIDSVLLASSTKDIIVFKIKNTNNRLFQTLSFAKNKPIKGDKVYNIGSPMGLESSVSEGIVSSFRTDSHGEIVQTTAPISPGSSGSPMLNEKGEVFAIATFKRRGGENLNFGVLMDENFKTQLDKNEFYKDNRKFSSNKTDFILLNILPQKGSDLMLHAIEFNPKATILYMSYVNIQLKSGAAHNFWVELNKKDRGLFIEKEKDYLRNSMRVENDPFITKNDYERYYVTSSTLASNYEDAEPVKLGEVIKFKVFFPAINSKNLNKINIRWDENSSFGQFMNIDLNYYRKNLAIDDYTYQREYALRYLTELGDIQTTMSHLIDLLDKNPSDVITLNMIAILSYLMENKADAMLFLQEAIDENPNDELAFLNRATIYEQENDYKSAIKDITSAISLTPNISAYYWWRALDYFKLEDYQRTLNDLNTCLSISEKEDDEEDKVKNNAYFYELRAYTNYELKNISSSREDCQTAYRLSNEEELNKRLENFWTLLW